MANSKFQNSFAQYLHFVFHFRHARSHNLLYDIFNHIQYTLCFQSNLSHLKTFWARLVNCDQGKKCRCQEQIPSLQSTYLSTLHPRRFEFVFVFAMYFMVLQCTWQMEMVSEMLQKCFWWQIMNIEGDASGSCFDQSVATWWSLEDCCARCLFSKVISSNFNSK